MSVGTDERSPAPALPASEKPSPFARIAGVFFSPVETLQSIAQRPDIVVPLVLLLLLMIPMGIIAATHVDFASAAREAVSANPNISPKQAARAVAFSQTIGRGVAYGSPLLSIVVVLIVAGIFLLAFRLMGGEGDYKQALSVVTYVWYVYIVEGALRSVILINKGMVGAERMATLLRSNLGFLTDLKEHPMLFALLSSIDIFNLWVLALLVIGFAFVSRLARAQSTAIVASLYMVVVLIKVALGALQMLGRRQ